jgi:hypothetical protein
VRLTCRATLSAGTVIELWRFPVLGLAGERLLSSRLDVYGVAGDNVHRFDGAEGPIRASRWSAAYPFTPDGAIDPDNPPYPTVIGPHGTFRWGDPRLITALQRDLGRPLEPVRDIDSPRGVIVATERPSGDPSRYGINVQLELERRPAGWSGVELEFEHGVRLRLFNSRADGPGIEAHVLSGGRVQLGETVVALG